MRHVTVDAVVFTGYPGSQVRVLLIKRGHAPFEGFWALPGGRVEDNENCETAVLRELLEETGMPGEIRPIAPFVLSDPDRDPRGPSINIAYVVMDTGPMNPNGGDDAVEAKWFSYWDLPPLAFDHGLIIDKMLDKYLDHMRG